MDATTIEVIEEAAREGAEVYLDVLKRRSAEENDLALARIGMTAVSNFAKLSQAKSSRDATIVTIMTHAAENKEEFRRLVMHALPASPVAKALNVRNAPEVTALKHSEA